MSGRSCNRARSTVGRLAHSAGTAVRVYRGRGDGTFDPAPRVSSVGKYVGAGAVSDLDGDGHDDLAIATGEGLSGDGVTFTVFPGRADGRLAAQPVSAGVALPKGATWRYGDVTGDGQPDLLALAGGTLSVHAAGGPTGLPAKRATATQPLGSAERPPRDQVQVTVGSGGSRVERQSERDGESAAPAEAAPAPEDAYDEGEDEDEPVGAAGFELVDLDGDGVLEVLRWEPAPEGRTRLSVIGLNSAPG